MVGNKDEDGKDIQYRRITDPSLSTSTTWISYHLIHNGWETNMKKPRYNSKSYLIFLGYYSFRFYAGFLILSLVFQQLLTEELKRKEE